MHIPPHHCKVVIVGAGFAGLSAAKTLCTQNSTLLLGRDVVVLEASNRLGGRAHTQIVTPQLSIELGATWIHGIGTEDLPNPILQAAIQGGLMSACPQPQQWWQSQFMLPGRTQTLSKQEQITIHKTIEAFAETIDNISGEDDNTTVGEILDHTLSLFLAKEERHKHPLIQAAWNWREKLQRAIDGCDDTYAVKASTRAMYSEFENSEVHAAIPSGYQSILESLADTNGLERAILYEHTVERILYSTTSMEGVDNKVTVQCSNKSEFTADAVILTVSLGVLKAQYKELFCCLNGDDDVLPVRISRAIERLSIGTVDKIFLDFSCSDNECIYDIQEALFQEPDTDVPSFSLLVPQEEEDALYRDLPEWTRGLFSLRFGGPEFKRRQMANDASSQHHQPNSYKQAVLWITGREAAQMEEASDAEVLAALATLLNRFPSIKPSLDPKIAQSDDWNSLGIKVFRSTWGKNSLTRGSYSIIGPQASKADVKALAHGIVAEDERPVILFAGEACHVRYIGTTTAAMITGKQAAERIRNMLIEKR